MGMNQGWAEFEGSSRNPNRLMMFNRIHSLEGQIGDQVRGLFDGIISAGMARPHWSERRDAFLHASKWCLVLILMLMTGCASAPPQSSASGKGGAAAPPCHGGGEVTARDAKVEQVQQRLAQIFHAAETKDLPRLDSYHWYGPHFTKFAGAGPRQDAASARDGEHKGLSALSGLKLRAEDLQIDVFHDAAVATFTLVANIGGTGGTSTASPQSNPVTKRERGTMVFVQHEGSWKIVHEHFSAAE